MDLIIDRAHRMPKPPFLADTIPRDVLARIHFFHIKEKVMKASRASPTLSEKFAGITLYTDLSAATISTRKQFITLTKAICNHNIPYQWGRPTKLLITKQHKIYAVHLMEKGLKLLKDWKILFCFS